MARHVLIAFSNLELVIPCSIRPLLVSFTSSGIHYSISFDFCVLDYRMKSEVVSCQERLKTAQA